MSEKFEDLARKSGDLYIVQTENGSLFVGNGAERIGDGVYRVWFSFKEGHLVFDSSVDARVSEIRQVVRNGITIWFNRG